MINRDRLAETFTALVAIDSVSRQEAVLCRTIRAELEALGARTTVDGAAAGSGSDTGNLIATFQGSLPAAPLLLNAHMDTVEPGRGIKALLCDGVFTSEGQTILGADDKSAIAILLETLRVLREQNIAHGPLELVFTVCEEIGLLGAKHLDYSLISAAYGYALDASDTEGIVTRAPAVDHLEFQVHGKDAHAGAAPEKGVNAIMLAAQAMAGLEIGRIDRETTCNIGLIEGGLASNIVPPLVTVKGEARSHDAVKLKSVSDKMVKAFREVVDQYSHGVQGRDVPWIDVQVRRDFPATCIDDSHPVVRTAQRAALNLGRSMRTKISGGGADANIFFEKGIMTGVLGTGMRDMHTTRENVRLDDMVKAAELVVEIIRLHAGT